MSGLRVRVRVRVRVKVRVSLAQNRNCCQNLVSNTGNIRLTCISRYCTVVSRNFISSLEIPVVSKDCFFCLFSVKKRRNWHRHDYSEIDDGSKVTHMNSKPYQR